MDFLLLSIVICNFVGLIVLAVRCNVLDDQVTELERQQGR